MKRRIFKQGQSEQASAWVRMMFGYLKENKQYNIEIKEHRNKRSNDANSYFWVLTDRLAKATGIPKTDIYRNAIKEIGGVSEQYCGKPEAIQRLCTEWRKKGIGWIAETYDSKLDGMLNAILYYGSSTYDTAQMSRLIDNVVQDCRALEIETATPQELSRYLQEWENAQSG